jgi:hypothetical protein
MEKNTSEYWLKIVLLQRRNLYEIKINISKRPMRIFYIKFRFNDISATYILQIKEHSIKTRLKTDIFPIIFPSLKKYTEK